MRIEIITDETYKVYDGTRFVTITGRLISDVGNNASCLFCNYPSDISKQLNSNNFIIIDKDLSPYDKNPNKLGSLVFLNTKNIRSINILEL